jgi:hypothetical protein
MTNNKITSLSTLDRKRLVLVFSLLVLLIAIVFFQTRQALTLAFIRFLFVHPTFYKHLWFTDPDPYPVNLTQARPRWMHYVENFISNDNSSTHLETTWLHVPTRDNSEIGVMAMLPKQKSSEKLPVLV